MERRSDRTRAQPASNSVLSFRNNTKYRYLLRCLLTCRTCGQAMYGVTRRATGKQPERPYCECHGKDCIASARPAPCPQPVVTCEGLDKAVWQHVVGLLSDPVQLAAQFEQATAREEAGTFRYRLENCVRMV